jgi:hypothetical protein
LSEPQGLVRPGGLGKFETILLTIFIIKFPIDLIVYLFVVFKRNFSETNWYGGEGGRYAEMKMLILKFVFGQLRCGLD